MKICIITDVPVDIEHGMGRYIINLMESLKLPTTAVFNILELDDKKVNYINTNFDLVSVQVGILKLDQLGSLHTLQKILPTKIATIHSVIDKEVELYKECVNQYFNRQEVEMNCIWGDLYQSFFLDVMDGFVFYTKNDQDTFNKYYNSRSPQIVIPPPVDYCRATQVSNNVKQNNKLAFLARVDYRKGIVASFNAMEFLTNYSLDVYGLIMNKHDHIILEHFLNKNANLSYKGLLQDKVKYFNKYSIFLGNSMYEPFGFSHVENLFNFITPVIGKDTGTHEVFGSEYPFVVGDSVPELVDVIKAISETSSNTLHKVLEKAQDNFKDMNTTTFAERYVKFLKKRSSV